MVTLTFLFGFWFLFKLLIFNLCFCLEKFEVPKEYGLIPCSSEHSSGINLEINLNQYIYRVV